MVNDLKISDNLTIDNLETLKVLSDPTRHEIMKYVGAENKRGQFCTVKQLAKVMGVSATKLYYHIKLLEEQCLLVVGDTRIVSGIIEKQYHVIAWNISLSQSALSTQEEPKDEALEKVFSSIEQIVGNSLNNVRTSLLTIYEEELAAKKGGKPARKQVAMHISAKDLLLSTDQAITFEKQLVKMMDDFEILSNQNLKNDSEDILWYENIQMFVPQYQRKIKI
jgi:DNA-binding transcriptional ArsR family regulator